MVEVYGDRALALPPLNTTLARRLMEGTRIRRSLEGVRGRKAANMEALELVLVRFSRLVVEQPWIKEVDVNPLLASPEGVAALDARVILHGPEVGQQQLPRPAIQPYPSQYVSSWETKAGESFIIRPICPEDEPLIVKFHEKLSERSVYYRYFHPMRLSQRVAHERLIRICFIDYAREIALVAERRNPDSGDREIVAVGRLIKLHDTGDAEFALLVSDEWQGRGLGTELLRRLVRIGRDEKLNRIIADILPDNYDMQKVCEKLGFKKSYEPGSGVVKATLHLEG